MKNLLAIILLIQSLQSFSQIEDKVIRERINFIINTIQKDNLTLFQNQFPQPDSLLFYKSKQDFLYKQAHEKLKSDSLKFNEYRNINKQFYISKFINYRYVNPLKNNWKNIEIIEIQKVKSEIEAGKQIEKVNVILKNIISNEIIILSVELDFLLYKNKFIDFTINEIHCGFNSMQDFLSFEQSQSKTIERAADNPFSKINDNEKVEWKETKQFFVSNNQDSIIAEFKYLNYKSYNKFQNIILKFNNETYNFDKRESLLREIYITTKNKPSIFSKEIFLFSNLEKETEDIWIALKQENYIDGYLFDKNLNMVTKTELIKN